MFDSRRNVEDILLDRLIKPARAFRDVPGIDELEKKLVPLAKTQRVPRKALHREKN